MRLSVLLSILLLSFMARAQSDSLPAPTQQISILTCGVGDELYSSFGHTGIRVKDSAQGLDVVYNYGTFDYNDPAFYSKFTLGKLLYYLDKTSFSDFLYTYQYEKRSVKEQVLDLTQAETEKLLSFLEQNLKPENRSYLYDFLFDNCATRVRDIFPGNLGAGFYFGTAFEGEQVSFRKVINQYLHNKHWERLGINLLLGSPVDSAMTNEASMFLPDYLHEGLIHAQVQSRHIVRETQTILAGAPEAPGRLNGPLWAMIGLLVLTVLAYLARPFHYLKGVIRFLLLFITGAVGVLMLFMWVGTNHLACANNYNILWALPLNLVVAFVAHKQRTWLKIYALAAISLLLVALIVHVIGFQQMPLIEISPLLLCLMYVYIDLYKHNIAAKPTAT